jgi:hypothetical protein
MYFFDVANVDFLRYMRYSLMLHILFLNVAKNFTCCMQHLRMLRREFSLLNYHPMLGSDVRASSTEPYIKGFRGK